MHAERWSSQNDWWNEKWSKGKTQAVFFSQPKLQIIRIRFFFMNGEKRLILLGFMRCACCIRTMIITKRLMNVIDDPKACYLRPQWRDPSAGVDRPPLVCLLRSFMKVGSVHWDWYPLPRRISPYGRTRRALPVRPLNIMTKNTLTPRSTCLALMFFIGASP